MFHKPIPPCVFSGKESLITYANKNEGIPRHPPNPSLNHSPHVSASICVTRQHILPLSSLLLCVIQSIAPDIISL